MKEGKYPSDILRKTFRDISKGFSLGVFEDKKIYIKHFTVDEQSYIDDKKDEYYNYALKRGLPKESEVLARLDKEGLWTKKDEDLIKSHDERIEHLNSSKKNAMTESQNSFFQEKIKEEKGKKIILECKKKALIGTTCETYRDSQMSKYFILSSLFKDKNFEHPFFDEENDIDDMDDFSLINDLYEKSTGYLSQDYILHLVVHPFFLQYFYLLGDDIYGLFGKPICNLTFLQIELLHSAIKYKNIFREMGDVPEDISLDPYKIVEYADNAKNMKELLEKNSSQDPNANSMKSIVGAKKEDLNKTGAIPINSILKEKSKGKGLNKNELLEVLKKR